MNQATQLIALLAQLKHAMGQAGLWQSETPSEQALQSSLPFCIDTLTFAQWLQFVLHPKLLQMAQEQLPLPSNIGVLPMAQHAFQKLANSTAVVEEVIARIDQLLSQGELS
ncbi:YqcC family protein [Motilimonas sp. KMU-193]|uniref:YqcC family protein n=1 Tax=Motilimonas sp. KMU-193 TaxID=3388668 RepID=UPI00396B21C5